MGIVLLCELMPLFVCGLIAVMKVVLFMKFLRFPPDILMSDLHILTAFLQFIIVYKGVIYPNVNYE